MPGGRFVLEHLGEEYINLIREFANDSSEGVLYKASKLSQCNKPTALYLPYQVSIA
jgi:hypothetical protein